MVEKGVPLKDKKRRKSVIVKKFVLAVLMIMWVFIAILIFYTLYKECLHSNCHSMVVIILGLLGFVLLEAVGFPCGKIIRKAI